MSTSKLEFLQRVQARIGDIEMASSRLDGRSPGAVEAALDAARDAFAAIDEFMRTPSADER